MKKPVKPILYVLLAVVALLAILWLGSAVKETTVSVDVDEGINVT